jgi:hypothetical protein
MEANRSGTTAAAGRRFLSAIGRRRFLDAAADILTLAALAAAGLGHLAPWIQIEARDQVWGSQQAQRPAESNPALPASVANPHPKQAVPGDLQIWHAMRSGAALGLAALLVGVSLTVSLGVRIKKILVLLMFVCVLAAIVFQILIFSPYPITDAHRSLGMYTLDKHDGFLYALVPSLIAAGLCLLRMTWTMTASSHKSQGQLR